MFFKRKTEMELLDLVPVQWDDDAALMERESREEAIALLKDMLGDKYLLHPSNMIERKEVRSVL